MPGTEGEGGRRSAQAVWGLPPRWIPPPQKAGAGGGREPEKGPPHPPALRPPPACRASSPSRSIPVSMETASRRAPGGGLSALQPPPSPPGVPFPAAGSPGSRASHSSPSGPPLYLPRSSSALHSPSLSRGPSRSRSGVASTLFPSAGLLLLLCPRLSSSSGSSPSPPPLSGSSFYTARVNPECHACAGHCARCGDAGGEVPRRRGVCVCGNTIKPTTE